MRLLFCPRLIVVFALCASPAFAGPDSPQDKPARGGSVPQDQRGRPLNFDFEAGNLSDWTAQGDAFTRQPVEGDAVSRRRGDMHSRHQGRFWVGTYEIAGDAPQGTLTSVPFRVSRPFASFLVAGGSQPTTCVELVRSDNQQVVFRTSGDDVEDLEPVVVDLSAQMGKEIVIRLIDRASGGWGHINFDDFRLHDTRPNLAPRRRRRQSINMPTPDLAPKKRPGP